MGCNGEYEIQRIFILKIQYCFETWSNLVKKRRMVKREYVKIGKYRQILADF